MAKTKTERQRFRAPLSGQIIGAAVRELRLQDEDLKSKTAARYFKGGRIKDDSKREIFEVLGQALVDHGIIPPSPFLEQEGISLNKVISSAIAWYADQWDRLVGYMRSASAPVDRPDLAASAYLRLATIDLSLRTTAALWLGELPAPDEGTPLWARNKGRSTYLRRLLDGCGPDGPTRDQLAERLEVSNNTIDNWLDTDTRPTWFHVNRLAEELAPYHADLGMENLQSRLHRHYTLSGLCDLLSAHVGRDAVVDLATALVRFVSRTLTGLRQFSKLNPDDAAKRQLFILLLGTRCMGTDHLLRALWRQEPDPVWSTDLLAASKPWHLRLTHVMQHLGELDQVVNIVHDEFGIPKEDAESLLDEVLRDVQADPSRLTVKDPSELDGMTMVRIKGDAKFSARNRVTQYAQAMSEGDLDTAILHVRRAVELQPESAEYHFHLGATLGMAGEVDEGVQECRIAAGLDPTWELPEVEVGIILLNAGREEEARDHLESVALSQSDHSAHLAFNLGMARLRCGEVEGALSALTAAIEVKPDHASALDAAAHCSFLLGDGKRGRRLAKRANLLGHSETYHDWQEGRYRKVKG